MSVEPDDVGYEEEVAIAPHPSADDMAAMAETHSLGRLKFQPYTPTRFIAAQAMGLRYGFVDKAGLASYQETGLYPGMPRDIAIVLWLCFQTDKFKIDMAARNSVEAAEEAIDWAFKKKIADPSGDGFWDARKIFLSIMDAVSQSRTVPKKKRKAKRTQ